MLRSLAVVTLVTLTAVASCKRENPPAPALTPPTLAESEAFAKQFASDMTSCAGDALNRTFDLEHLTVRAVAGRNIHRAQVAQLRRELRAFGNMLCTQIGGATVQYLRTQMVNSAPRPLLRMIGDAGVNYYQLELDSRAGRVRAADIYFFGSGEWLSESFGNLTETVLASPTRNAGGKFEELRTLTVAKDYEAARRVFESLPADIRGAKSVMLMGIMIASGLNNEVGYLAAIEKYETAFPKDPSLDLVQIDGAVLRKDYEELLAIVDRLDKRVGGDPYLEVIRADAFQAMGRPDEAIAAGRRITTGEPSLVQGWWTLLTQQAATKDFAGAVATLEVLRDKFSANIETEDLRADERFTALVESPVYVAWLERATPR